MREMITYWHREFMDLREERENISTSIVLRHRAFRNRDQKPTEGTPWMRDVRNPHAWELMMRQQAEYRARPGIHWKVYDELRGALGNLWFDGALGEQVTVSLKGGSHKCIHLVGNDEVLRFYDWCMDRLQSSEYSEGPRHYLTADDDHGKVYMGHRLQQTPAFYFSPTEDLDPRFPTFVAREDVEQLLEALRAYLYVSWKLEAGK